MANQLIIEGILVLGMAITIAYFFDSSVYLLLIILLVLEIVEEIIHMTENVPQEYDNPEDTELDHTKAIVVCGVGGNPGYVCSFS